MKIAVVGAGSLGTIIGGLITQAGYNVDLIDINKENIEGLNQHGAQISGHLNTVIPVSAKHYDDLESKYDTVFLLTKQVFTEAALSSISPFLHEESVVCTLQNGVPEEKVASIVGSDRTVGGCVGFGATWKGPGKSELATKWETVKKYAFDIGELNGEISERLITIKKILDTIGDCEMSTNILGVKWSKLLMNATFSGMSASLNCTFGDVLNNEDAMKSLANIADETIKVARANNIQLEKIQGKDMEFLELENQESILEKMEFYHEVWGPHANTKASMLQDLEKNIKTEIDFINGYVVKKGSEQNLSTPFNDLVCELVKKSEMTKDLPIFDQNIEEFQTLNNKM
ncbi:ketopantoate reductase family protein [Salsuginibacillus kocurii]|uniref:ketopantoate reductase family protein n=1 Tax=Salsuginibacillus kocurii TaxID=427078 RepID=UPI00036A1DF4|nr:ketopantoate reductase family protein [Salsuginibacillus kocurii]